MARKSVFVGLLVGLFALGTGAAVAGTHAGNGAQRSSLSPASNGGNPMNCSQGSGSSAAGWAMLNKTGAPVAGTSSIQGEVHVVDRMLAGQTLTAFAVPSGSGSCMSMVMGMITLNRQGIGNGHLTGMASNGSYYVTIMQGSNEVLASNAVPLL